MKSIYYNWIKSKICPDNHMFSKTEEEMWGQFIDLETNNFYNNQYKTFPHYIITTNTKTTRTTANTLVKYEPALFTIQENVQSNTIIFDATPSPFIMSMILLGCYALVQIFIRVFMVYNSNPA